MGKIFANTFCSLSENFVSKIAKHKLQATLDKIRKTTGVAVDKTDISFVFEGDWDNIYHAHNCLEEIYNEEVACSNACEADTDDVLNPPQKYTDITNAINFAANNERKLEADAEDASKYVENTVTDELCNTQQETSESSRPYMTEKYPDNERQRINCKILDNSNISCFNVASAGEIIDKSGQCQNDDTEVCSNEIKQEMTPSHKNETVNIVDSTTGMFIAEIKIKKEPPEEIELHVDSSSYPVEGQLKQERADVSDDENNKGCHSPFSVSAERENNTEKELDRNSGNKFECDICSKKFGTKKDMKQHLHRIHTDQGYFCTFKLSNKHLHMCKDKQDEKNQPRIFSCPDQEKNFNQNIKNQNTAKKDNLCARQFHRWLSEAGDTRRMWDIPPADLDKLIGSFLLSIRKADGEEYEPDTLTSYHRGIERCLREHDYPSDIVTDKEFAASRAALKSKRKELREQGKGNRPNAAEPLSDGEEEILREKECIGTKSPQQLLNAIWLNNTMFFGLRSGRESHKLRWGDIRLKSDENGCEYLEYNGRLSKTKPGEKTSSVRKAFRRKQFAQTNSERCPVHIYKEFSRHRPANMCEPDSPFYLAINHIRRPWSDTWYKVQSLGENSLRGMMKKMAEQAGIRGRKTNQSARKNTCTKLLDAGTDQNTIQQSTGDQDVHILSNNSKVKNENQKHVSNILKSNSSTTSHQSTSNFEQENQVSISLSPRSPPNVSSRSKTIDAYQNHLHNQAVSSSENSSTTEQILPRAQMVNCNFYVNSNNNSNEIPPPKRRRTRETDSSSDSDN